MSLPNAKTPEQVIEAAVLQVEQAGTADLLVMLRDRAEGAVCALRDLDVIGYSTYRNALDTIEVTAEARSAQLEAQGGAQ